MVQDSFERYARKMFAQAKAGSQHSELDRLRKENAALRDLLASCLAHGSFPQGSGILHAIRAALQGAKDSAAQEARK